MKTAATIVVLALLVAGGLINTRALAQEPIPTPRIVAPTVGEPDPTAFRRGVRAANKNMSGNLLPSGAAVESAARTFSQADFEELQAYHQAVTTLYSAKNDEEKTKAATALTQILEKSFVRDLEQREKEVADIEARVKKLRDQIEKRKKAKAEIIGLRLKTIVNEADGLGFGPPLGGDVPLRTRGGDPKFDPFYYQSRRLKAKQKIEAPPNADSNSPAP